VVIGILGLCADATRCSGRDLTPLKYSEVL
jgi:hypothetical protein